MLSSRLVLTAVATTGRHHFGRVAKIGLTQTLLDRGRLVGFITVHRLPHATKLLMVVIPTFRVRSVVVSDELGEGCCVDQRRLLADAVEVLLGLLLLRDVFSSTPILLSVHVIVASVVIH